KHWRLNMKSTEALKVASVDVVNPEYRMRIAHAHNRRRAQHRLVDGTNLQLNRAGVAELLGKWDLVPHEAWHTHIDREQPVGILPAIEYARRRFKGERILSALLCHQVCDTSHAVTAGARLRTIIIVDANEGISSRRARCIKRHQLIVWGTAGRSRRRCFLGFDRPTARAHIDDDNLVANSVHLNKGLVGERAHIVLPGFRPVYMANKRRLARGMLGCAAMLAKFSTAALDGER